MGYVDPESFYYCNGCGTKVPVYNSNRVTYHQTHESGGKLESQQEFCDICNPGEHDITVPSDGWIPGDEVLVGTGWRLNPDPGRCQAIRKRLKVTGGQCPCIAQDKWTEDTMCPCLEFRSDKGCHCSLYVPFEPELPFEE